MDDALPVHVRWRSKDAVEHEADGDVGKTFREQSILHEVPRTDIRETVSIVNPDILLDVNDRTINVDMRAFIPAKPSRTPERPRGDFRSAPVLAWRRTY